MVSRVNSALTDYSAGQQYTVVELTSPHGNANPSTSLAVAGSGAIGMSAAATITSHVTANDVSDSSLPPMRGVTEAGVAVDIDRWPWR